MKETYRNIFAEMGIAQQQIDKRLREIRDFYFDGKDDERVYYPVGDDMAYIMDTGNNDARTEGMSYGMMLCVQLDLREAFDRLWKWTKTYMWMPDGENEGYFAWSCATDGTKKCRESCAGRRRVFCDGAVFCIAPVGRRRGDFQLFP